MIPGEIHVPSFRFAHSQMTVSKSVSAVISNFACFSTRRRPCGMWNRSSSGITARGSGENQPIRPRLSTAIGKMPRRYAANNNSASSIFAF